jgi:DNA-binding XRE family transcriptional regulator
VKYKKKWYDNSQWLRMMYVEKKLTKGEIADYAGVSEETIRKLLISYGIK